MTAAIYTRSGAAGTHGDGAPAHERCPGGGCGERFAPDRGMWMIIQRMLAGIGRALRPHRRRRAPAAHR
jgi:hypothetical protein